MKRVFAIFLSILATGTLMAGILDLFGSVGADEIRRVRSPDGRSIAILLHKASRGPTLPPEPAKVRKRWARLKVERDGRKVYDSGFEDLNVHQTQPGFALDVEWAPNSARLAYRHIASLRIIEINGKSIRYVLQPDDSVVSSFRWVNAESLLIVSKRVSYLPDMHGAPNYFSGYIGTALDIRVLYLHLTDGQKERFHQDVQNPTFLFHSADFLVNAISPKADRVAFSDGAKLCVYDDKIGKLVAAVQLPREPTQDGTPETNHSAEMAKLSRTARKVAQIEGVWWPTNDTLLIGTGLLSGEESFFLFDLAAQVFTDKTDLLRPVWFKSLTTQSYRDDIWYRAAID